MSKTGIIPFSGGQASGLQELSGASPLVLNFLPDAGEALRVRPGIEDWDDFPTEIPNASPVIGMFPWRQYIIYVCEDRTIWAWLASGLVQALSDTDPLTQLDGDRPPVWTFDSDRVAVTGGGAPQQWQGSGLSERLAPAALLPSGSPLALTHIAYSAQAFIGNANDNSGFIVWSEPGPGGHTVWPIVGPFFIPAATSPDPVLAVHATANEVFAFGSATTQVYVPDPNIAFSPGASLATGLSEAVYSVVETEDGAFGWLDNNRRFVYSDGRQLDAISSPGITATAKALQVIDDCWSANMMIEAWDLLFWSFPTEKRSFYYDRVTKKWGEWDSTDERGVSTGFLPRCYLFWPEQNLHLVGLQDGRIGVLSMQALRDDGNQIIALSRTGFNSRGTLSFKTGERVQLQLKRGFTAPGTTVPVVEYRYRDDFGPWSQAQRRSLGEGGDYATVVNIWSQGMYRSREHEVRFTDAGEFVLAGAIETYSIGDS
jgi:hypothetical protein